MLGGRYTRLGETTGMFGELQGRSTDVAEVSERAREATRSYLTPKVSSGEGYIPAYVRSVSVRPDAVLRLYVR